MKGNDRITNKESIFLGCIVGFEEKFEDLAHPVFPLNSHHQSMGLGAHSSSFQLFNRRFHEYFPLIPVLNFPFPHVQLASFDRFGVFDEKLGSGN